MSQINEEQTIVTTNSNQQNQEPMVKKLSPQNSVSSSSKYDLKSQSMARNTLLKSSLSSGYRYFSYSELLKDIFQKIKFFNGLNTKQLNKG